MRQILFRCPSCSYALIVDEGKTFAIHLGHWRINKTTGRVTAQCPRCPAIHVIEPGEVDVEPTGTMPSILFRFLQGTEDSGTMKISTLAVVT